MISYRLAALWLMFLVSIAPGARAAEAPTDYTQSIDQARATRVQHLTARDGWLTVVGLHFLETGRNTIGSAPTNRFVIANVPAQLGTVTLTPEGRTSVALNPAADALIDGRHRLSAQLDPEFGGEPPRITCGPVTLLVIERGGRKALRVKDQEAPARTHFRGLDYFPTDAAWRIEAEWVPFDRPRQVMFRNVLGQESPALVPGKAVFQHDGKTCELIPLVEDEDQPWLFVFADETSGNETYGAARFVSADPPVNGKIVLDFNLAVNPPCAFTAFATCPLPPKENRLPLAVRAGEKAYAAAHP